MSTEETPQETPQKSRYDPAVLSENEVYWKDQYGWLLEAGYRLRSRYSPDWKPSWEGKKKVEPLDCEDAQKSWFGGVNHAIRLETNRFVVLKRIDKSKHPREIDITNSLAQEPLASEPRNHSVHPIEILDHPTDKNIAIMVLPLLRNYDDPPFRTVGEAIDFIAQFFEGVNFLHENLVTHGDISLNNILMDAEGQFPSGFHPSNPAMKSDYSGSASAKFTRTEKPPIYYLIDFGLARRFEPGEEPGFSDEVGTDLTVPEYLDSTQPVNPFFVDVYCVGNMIKYEFLDGDPQRSSRRGYHGFEFLRPLIEDMVKHNSAERPTMAEVVARFDAEVKKLSVSTLRSRCLRKTVEEDKDPLPLVVATTIRFWYERAMYTIRRLPPVPTR
ncbi:hypothetical protein H1R20_g4537, partial [Candolleomyces eurysporus]